MVQAEAKVMEQPDATLVIDMPLSELLGGGNPVLDEIMRRVVEQAENPDKICAFNSAV